MTGINFEALEELVRANERAPGFNLGTWSCGTYGCLWGNYRIAKYGDILPGKPQMYQAMDELQISPIMARWLFREYNPVQTPWGVRCYGKTTDFDRGTTRNFTDRTAAIARVKKFIAYKRRKKSILYDSHGRINDLARRQEGDWNVVKWASEFAVAT